MLKKETIVFLWKLKNNEKNQTQFERIDLKKIDYMKNSLFCRKIFRILDQVNSKEELEEKIQTLFLEDEFKKWVNEFKHMEDNFHMIIKLNYINEKAKPHH